MADGTTSEIIPIKTSDESTEESPPASGKHLETKKTNGDIPKNTEPEKGDDAKQKDVPETEGLVMDSLKSPRQTRVRRISAELRLSASSSVENLKKAGKGLSTGLQNVANKLPVPKSLRRRSWSYEEFDENSLLPPESPDGDGSDDMQKSKSSENLKKAKDSDSKEGTNHGDKRFLRRKWEARKNRHHEESKGDEKNEKKDEMEDDDLHGDKADEDPHGDRVLSVDSIPVVFEPLTLEQRPLTPTVTICHTDDDDNMNTNPFLD